MVQTYQALVVDDEALMRQVTVRALMKEGFRCDTAADGVEAARMLEANQYDVLITDLRMPNRHGHALATDLLQRSDRPLIIVVTGVLEPRLAKDLYARGVDDIIWKPVTPVFLGLKVKTLVDRRRQGDQQRVTGPQTNRQQTGSTLPAAVSSQDLDNRLSFLSTILPVSQVALEVFNMASEDAHDAKELAAAAARDPALTVELLRLANGSYYNPTREHIQDLERAIARIGQKRVGELALATNALALLSRKRLPWMDLTLAWKRSMAAGIAMELLIQQGGHASIAEGLLLDAIMSHLGRMVLASLYPEVYRQMIAALKGNQRTLQQCEAEIFPEHHAKILARSLASWRIPSDITRPLEHILEPYPALSRLPDPIRLKVELIKTAILVGRLALDKWQEWDTVEFPPETVLKRLRVTNVWALLEQTRNDLQALLALHDDAQATKQPVNTARSGGVPVEICYHCLSDGSFDFLRAMLPAMEIRTTAYRDGLEAPSSVLVNCFHTHPQRLSAWPASKSAGNVLVVTDDAHFKAFAARGKALSLPASFAALKDACLQVAHARQFELAQPLASTDPS